MDWADNTGLSILCPGHQESSVTVRNSQSGFLKFWFLKNDLSLVLIIVCVRGQTKEILEPNWSILHLSFFSCVYWGRSGVLSRNHKPLEWRHFMQRKKVSRTSSTGLSLCLYMVHANSIKVNKTKDSCGLAKVQAQSSLHPHDLFSTYMLGVWAWTRRYWSHLLTSKSVISNSAPLPRLPPTPLFNQRISEFIRVVKMGFQVRLY